MGRTGAFLGGVPDGQGQQGFAFILTKYPAAVRQSAQHRKFLPCSAGGQGDGVQADPARLHVPFHRQRAGIGALYFVEDTLPNDTGEGNLSSAGFKPSTHAIALLAAVGSVAVSSPVVEQNREFFVLGGGDGFQCLIDHKEAISVLLLYDKKKDFASVQSALFNSSAYLQMYRGDRLTSGPALG